MDILNTVIALLGLLAHFSRQGGAGKQPVVRNGYPKAIGEE